MFVGQDNIVNELNLILPNIRNSDDNVNILFRARSGYGKTTLAYLCLNYLGFNNSGLYLPLENTLSPDFMEEKRFHFIDEIHTLKTPEFLYPLMDSRRYTFILASNESGSLKEPLINRCIQYIFSPYTDEEILNMVKNFLGLSFQEEFYIEIANRVKRNPRIAKILCTRLNHILKNIEIPQNVESFEELLNNFMGIDEGGLNRLDLTYLEYLRSVNVASLNNIIGGTGIDRATILREIEPFLLYKKIIKITSKGREIC